MSNTLFQVSNFNLIDRGLDLYDYVSNKDISATTYNKLVEFVSDVRNVLCSSEFAELKEAAIMVADIAKKKDIYIK